MREAASEVRCEMCLSFKKLEEHTYFAGNTKGKFSTQRHNSELIKIVWSCWKLIELFDTADSKKKTRKCKKKNEINFFLAFGFPNATKWRS